MGNAIFHHSGSCTFISFWHYHILQDQIFNETFMKKRCWCNLLYFKINIAMNYVFENVHDLLVSGYNCYSFSGLLMVCMYLFYLFIIYIHYKDIPIFCIGQCP